MPTFEITTPQGKYQVTVPEGQGEREAYQHLQGQLRQEFEGRGIGQKALETGRGLARGVSGAVAGMVNALPDVGPPSPLGRELTQRMQEFGSAPPASEFERVGTTVGDIAGNAAPMALAPEAGLGRLAINAAPYMAGAYGLYKQYERRGIEGVLSALGSLGLAGAGLGAAGHYLPTLLRLARQARRVAPAVGRVAGKPLEAAAVGTAQHYLGDKSTGGSDDRDSRPAETPRGASVQPGGEAFRPGRGDRFRRDDAATD